MWAPLALLLAACPSPERPPPPEPAPKLYASDYGTLQVAVFDSSQDEPPPLALLGVPLTTTYPLVALSQKCDKPVVVDPEDKRSACEELAVADTAGIRFYRRTADGPPQLKRMIPGAFKQPVRVATRVDKNLLVVVDAYPLDTQLPHGTPRDAQVDVYLFPLDASGPTPPLRTLSWKEPIGRMWFPTRPAIDFEHEEIFFTTGLSSTVNVYPLSGSGPVSPLRSFQLAGQAWLLELDAHAGELFAASLFSQVSVYPRAASGEVAPLRTLQGVSATDLAIDSVHDELVAISQGQVAVYPRSGSGAVAALRSFSVNGSRVVVDPAHDEMVVGGGSRLATYARQARGEARPLREIWDGGPSYPAAVALDEAERTLLLAHGSGFVETYPLSGGPPLRTLRGPLTRLDDSRAMALDTQRRELFVSNRDSITVHPVEASGDVAPLRVIAGPATELVSPWGLAVDEARGELYVANWLPAPGSILVYARDANGEARPVRKISGPRTGLNWPRGIALDLVHDEVLVANYAGSVTAYPLTAQGNVAPLRTLDGPSGSPESINLPTAIAYDATRDVLAVASVGEGRIHVFPRLATSSGPALRGFSTGLKHPTGIAFSTGTEASSP